MAVIMKTRKNRLMTLISSVGVISIISISSALANEAKSVGHSLVATPAEYIVKTVISLGMVIAAIIFVAWMAKKINRSTGASVGAITVVDTLSIGSREKIILIEVGGEQLLLGATQNNIVTLITLKEKVQRINGVKNHTSFNKVIVGLIRKEKKGA